MRRFFLCLVLLALSLVICAVSRFTVDRNAGKLYEQVNEALSLVLDDRIEDAKETVEACRSAWKNSSLPFFVYLDHGSFAELEYQLDSVSVFLDSNQELAAEQLQRCRVILADIMEQQKIKPENIF